MNIGILKDYANVLQAKFSLPGAASPEDQLKAPVAQLLEQLGGVFGLTVESRTETHLSEHRVRPDIAIHVDKLICGYIELKAPGRGADAPKLKKTHDKTQWKRLQALPNLIYTDGRDWALYRSGERRGRIVRFRDDPTTLGEHAVSGTNLQALGSLVRDFLFWTPIVPHRPRPLAEYLAPLTRFLRLEVEAALTESGSAASLLANEWRQYFFPDADDGQFADAYAQTVVYALLLARLSGADDLDPSAAASQLDKNNGVLALALDRLGQRKAREELRVGFELLQRSLKALNPDEFLKTGPDIWLYFYEDFLAAYDPKLRKDYGVYYTPREVVELQVRLVSSLLETRFDKICGFADDGVVFLDPAVGTGTYLVAAVKDGLARARARYGDGVVPARGSQMARNMYGFEILIGPYAVSHLRLTQALESEGTSLRERLNIFLADTLDSPHVAPPGGLTLTYKVLTEEHEAARRLKSDGEILVCLGNPPYDREQRSAATEKRRKGGWVRHGDHVEGGDKQEKQGERAIFEAFLEPAKRAGKGRYLQVIFNDYVYFWRWALWRLFEQQDCGGIISFITPSSYLAGPGFVGVRETMRRTFDELWIIDLGGDNLGARKTPNVFAIQIPVAIAIGMRGKCSNPAEPARVRYVKVDAPNREEKLGKLEQIANVDSLNWLECCDDWQSAFVPQGRGDFFKWPAVTDIFPFHTAGSVFYRSWPISESKEVLQSRWNELATSAVEERKKLFKESRDRKIVHKVHSTSAPGYGEPPIYSTTTHSNQPQCIRYGYRSMDRQFALFDSRLGDYIRPTLYRIAGDKQLFFISPNSLVPGIGPIIVASAHIPDQHCFRGSFGGRDVMPLYRDRNGEQPNITAGLLETLGAQYGEVLSAEDLAAYVYALLAGQSYTTRYWNELETPGARVPITKDGTLFRKIAEMGRKLIWLQTYAERCRGDNRGKRLEAGRAKCTVPVSDDPSRYPEDFEWMPDGQSIRVGRGRFGPVTVEVWNFEISGLKIVQSWLGYRMKQRAGKKSSPLDGVRPERWTPQMSEELLELLWVLEATLAMEPELANALEHVVNGACYEGRELPSPKDEERKPPKESGAPGSLIEMTFTEGENVQ